VLDRTIFRTWKRLWTSRTTDYVMVVVVVVVMMSMGRQISINLLGAIEK
jgi:hypothetical protein